MGNVGFCCPRHARQFCGGHSGVSACRLSSRRRSLAFCGQPACPRQDEMMLVQSLRVWVCFAPLGANFFLLERSGDRKYSEYTYMLFIRAVLGVFICR